MHLARSLLNDWHRGGPCRRPMEEVMTSLPFRTLLCTAATLLTSVAMMSASLAAAV